MSEETLIHDNFDYCNEDNAAMATPGSPDQHGTTPVLHGNAKPTHQRTSLQALDIEIAKKQLLLLQKKRALEMEEALGTPSSYSPSEFNESSGLPLYAAKQKSRRRLAMKQQLSQEESVRDAGGSKTRG